MALILPNDFVNGTPHDASKVQENMDAIESHVNTELIRRDGGVAMTGQLSLVGDPVADNDAMRKKYFTDRLKGPTAYTPVLQGSVGNPNLGSTGNVAGQWWQIGDSLYVVEFAIEFGGSGITQGSGDVRITIPFQAAKFTGVTPSPMQGLVTVRDNSANQARAFLAYVATHGDQFVVIKGIHTVSFTADANITHTAGSVGITYAATDSYVGKLFFTKA